MQAEKVDSSCLFRKVKVCKFEKKTYLEVSSFREHVLNLMQTIIIK